MKQVFKDIDLRIIDFLIEKDRIPANLLLKNRDYDELTRDNLIDVYSELPNNIQKSLNQYIKVIKAKPDRKSVIISGHMSLYTDKVAICILLYYAHYFNKQAIYYGYPNTDINIAPPVIAIMNVPICTNFYLPNFKTKLVDIITKGKVFIISCYELDELYNMFGDSIYNMLISNSVEINLPPVKLQEIVL